MEYTKGEWYWENPFEDEAHKYHNLRCKNLHTDEHILYTHSGVRTGADANLIASAPDMYEALKELRNDSQWVKLRQSTRLFIVTALAKAEGKENGT